MKTTFRQAWLETTLGQYLLGHERAMFDGAVADIFGFNALQIGFLEVNLLANSRIPHLLYVDEQVGGLKCDALCQCDALPFDANSIDLVLLPHVLEFSENPHQTLREVERILVHEGYLILTGFNPFSAWGVRRLLTKKLDGEITSYPWQGDFFSQTRIKDWLALLGLEFVSVSTCCYNVPYNHAKWFNRLKLLDNIGSKCWSMLGGMYFIVAKKRVAGMTLLKPNWKKSPIKTRLAVTSPQKMHHPKKNKVKIKIEKNG